MPIRKATATWEGNLSEGKGHIKSDSGAIDVGFSFGTRFEDKPGTNPEELIGGALAGCFSMAFAHILGGAGYEPKKISTRADVEIEKADDGFQISSVHLTMEGEVPEIEEANFQELANNAKEGCPVSKALAGTNISLNAKLTQ